MKRLMWSRAGVIALLLIAIAAVGTLKQSTEPNGAPSGGAVHAASVRTGGPGLPRLLDLGSTSCIPCRMMTPILEELKKTYAGKLQVDFIDVWKDQEAGRQYGIEAIPTQIIFDASGRELYRHTGYYSKEDIVAKLNELGIKP